MSPCAYSYGEHKSMLMANIDENELSKKMLNVYQNYDLYKNKAAEGRKLTLGWDSFPMHFLNTIKNLDH